MNLSFIPELKNKKTEKKEKEFIYVNCNSLVSIRIFFQILFLNHPFSQIFQVHSYLV